MARQKRRWNVKDLEKVARTIAGLYNNASSPGMGAFSRVDGNMRIEEALSLARKATEDGNVSFDWHRGRVMKVDVRADGSLLRTDLYDRDNGGNGAAVRAIDDGLTDPSYDFGYLVEP